MEVFLQYFCPSLSHNSLWPKPGFGIGNRNQGPVSVLVSELIFFETKTFFNLLNIWEYLKKIVKKEFCFLEKKISALKPIPKLDLGFSSWYGNWISVSFSLTLGLTLNFQNRMQRATVLLMVVLPSLKSWWFLAAPLKKPSRYVISLEYLDPASNPESNATKVEC